MSCLLFYLIVLGLSWGFLDHGRLPSQQEGEHHIKFWGRKEAGEALCSYSSSLKLAAGETLDFFSDLFFKVFVEETNIEKCQSC